MPAELIKKAIEAAEGYRSLRMYEDAWQELERLAPEDRAEPEVLNERVLILIETKRFDAALALIEGLLNAGASDPDLLLHGSKAARRSGDFAKAKKFLLRTFEHFGNTPMQHYWLAVCECQLGDLEAAKRYLTEAFRRDEDMREQAMKEPHLAPLWDSMATKWP